jgi:hypothetical protein
MTSSRGSFVRPDGAAELTHDDLLVVLGALDMAAWWAEFSIAWCTVCSTSMFCARHLSLGQAITGMAALAYALGDDL